LRKIVNEHPETESMKKMARARKASKTKAPRQKRVRQANPVLDVLQNLDEEEIAMLREIIESELGADPEMFESKDAVALFVQYLENCARRDMDDDDRAELLEELSIELGDLKVASNGGDREAREKIQAVYDLLDDAIEARSMEPGDVMLTGKMLTDAGWTVPESMRQALTEALQACPPDSKDGAAGDIVSLLLELADQTGQNPFDVYGHVSSMLAAFPPNASALILFELIAANKPVITQVVAGFVLHSEAVLAQAATEALAAHAKQTPVESSLIERLVRMRPWLPPARQAQLDAVIRPLRSNALPPVKLEMPKLIKCYVSVCDGSGARSVFATQRLGARYQFPCVMIKTSGVDDAKILPDLPKSEMDDIVRQLKSSMPVMETDLAGIARMLELAIAENAASGSLPPFALVEVVERLGLGPIHPNHAAPIELITNLLADLPPEQTNKAAVSRANADILGGSELEHQWFEAGETLEELLYPVKGFKQRVAKLMTAFLPERRLFWARQCAISALAMRSGEKVRPWPWKQLALIGREIASDVPLDQIPLMKQVAETSVRAFERRP
jgi:hypothetical protein